MIKIRFLRIGRKHNSAFRLVAVESRRGPRSGNYLENLGFYNPRQKNFQLNSERINYWISKGAQVSNSAYNLLIKAGILRGRKINVFHKKKRSKDGEKEKAEAGEGDVLNSEKGSELKEEDKLKNKEESVEINTSSFDSSAESSEGSADSETSNQEELK